jgi:hypothetical protein
VAGGATPAAAVEAGAAAEVAAVGLGLLAIQAGQEEAARDAAAEGRAAALLEELGGLQLELLGGGRGGAESAARLERLAALQAGDTGVDPGLREVVEAVALRARVELAKRRRE